MRKFKELTLNEKLLIIIAILLLSGIILKWPQVKQGFVNGWKHFGLFNNENVKQ